MVFANFDSGHQALSNHLRAKIAVFPINELKCEVVKAMLETLPTHHRGFWDVVLIIC